MEAKGYIIPDVKNVKNAQKWRRREAWAIRDTNHGGERVRMLDEDD